MRTLLSERFAPITSNIGFIHAPLDDVAAAASKWTAGLQPNTRATRLHGGLEESLLRLEPLVASVRPRMLYVEAASGGWTAYFDCLASGSDPVAPIFVLAKALRCDAVRVTTIPDEYGRDRSGRQGAVFFELLTPGPGGEAPVLARHVSAARENSKMVFEEHGDPLPFEQTERYTARRVRDRLTADMVDDYCRALGLAPFDAASYGPRSVLVECDAIYTPKGSPRRFSLAEVQADLGIVPGRAEGLRP